jgi:hypothetical protein
MPRGIVALVFCCKVTGGQLAANDEVTAFRWADEADIRQLTSDAYSVRILDALREGTAPAIPPARRNRLARRKPQTAENICCGIPSQSAHVPHAVAPSQAFADIEDHSIDHASHSGRPQRPGLGHRGHTNEAQRFPAL